MVYFPTFTIKINQMYVNIHYMDPMGYLQLDGNHVGKSLTNDSPLSPSNENLSGRLRGRSGRHSMF